MGWIWLARNTCDNTLGKDDFSFRYHDCIAREYGKSVETKGGGQARATTIAAGLGLDQTAKCINTGREGISCRNELIVFSGILPRSMLVLSVL